MLTIYARADGTILHLLSDTAPGDRPSVADAPLRLAFDESTNPALLDAVTQAWDAHSLAAGAAGDPPTLLHAGVPVPIASTGPAAQAVAHEALLQARLAAQLDALRTIAGQLDTASKATNALTLAQVTSQLRQTQGALATVTIALLRTARLAARQLDALD